MTSSLFIYGYYIIFRKFVTKITLARLMIEREKGGDECVDLENSFEKIYRTYFMEIYSYVMTIVKNPEQAEEITQEAFYRAMKSKSSYRKEASERTWLCAIAKNICMDRFRKKHENEMLSEEMPASVDIEKMMMDKDASFRIHQVLHRLEEPYKEVFGLRIFGELSFQSIGQIFGKSENWARVTYHRARLKIQERLLK